MYSRLLRAGLVVLVSVLLIPAVAHAQLSSPNFEVDEIFIGSGGELEACGTVFCAHQSVGGTGGEAGSENYGMISGFGSPDEPALSLVVGNTAIDLGVLSTSGTAAASTGFSVASYLSDGYIVRIHGNTPTNVTGPGTYSLDAMDGASGSIVGEEQFGINLVANSNPGIGTNPVQSPDSSFSYGAPTVAYSQADVFKYEDGDIIASSDVESGQTDFTMSIIANIATRTPGGRYRTTLVVQAIATF